VGGTREDPRRACREQFVADPCGCPLNGEQDVLMGGLEFGRVLGKQLAIGNDNGRLVEKTTESRVRAARRPPVALRLDRGS
jgi:hypothetical protein